MLEKLKNPNFVSLKSDKKWIRNNKNKIGPLLSAATLGTNAAPLAKIEKGMMRSTVAPKVKAPSTAMPKPYFSVFLHTDLETVINLAVEFRFKQLFLCFTYHDF